MFRKLLVIIAAVVVMAPLLARLISLLNAQGRVYNDGKDIPHHRVALVFGAGIRNGLPTPMLYDRVASAVSLYQAGVVDKLLMSGDNRYVDYNEPAVMRRTATQLGVPERDIVMDYAGRSTYDTCYRARDIFGLNDAVLVTQRFHLDRALLACDALGVSAVGFPADRQAYPVSLIWSTLREVPATLNAFVELYVTKPLPVLGERLP
ncbi:MAG TPA: ElyC/SanA/YdcF family protein, partial [Anaerolineae bacterium]